MIVHWSLVALPALLSLAEHPLQRQPPYRGLAVGLIAVVFVVMALRATGGDFFTYHRMYLRFGGGPLTEWLARTEPLYGLANWLSSLVGGHVYGANTICAAIFLYCLVRFAREEKLPFFLLTIAMPYFVIVLGIGYTRQGVAAALIMLAMIYLRRGQPLVYLGVIMLAAGFHVSAAMFAVLPA